MSEPNLQEILAEEILVHMARRRYTQKALAEKVDITESQMSRKLRALDSFDIDELERLAELFDVSPHELLLRTGRFLTLLTCGDGPLEPSELPKPCLAVVS